ncbi:Zn-dependent hydrolase [Acuticoccus sp.]|uniref:Zn-dependent hydrolase n=1 Tax=Acuticoccus sp. TaxID=1904378 RepID=UPI003B52FAB9
MTDPMDLAARLFDGLAALSQDPPGVTRPSFSHQENAAHALLADCAADLGCTTTHDAAGHQYMTWPGADRDAPRVIVGSHVDTVAHGGNYDGAAGVVMGLAALALLRERDVRPSVDLCVMAIRAEELVWFPTPYCGSRMAFGLLDRDELTTLARSDTGRTLADHMREVGADPDALRAAGRTLDPATIAAFIEPHIEQGPVLEAAGEAVGIVTGIRGNLRYRHGTITGRWDHAGAVPREHRADAVRAGAALVVEVEDLWDAHDAAGEDFVATFGEFWTDPTMHGLTKVPGHVRFTLDMRSLDNALLWWADDALRGAARRIGEAHGVTIDLGAPTNAEPALMDERLMRLLEEGAAALGVPHRRMPSGGGHDCATFAGQGVPSAMLFVCNQNGSHNPDEAMRMEDFAAATRVLARTLEALL